MHSPYVPKTMSAPPCRWSSTGRSSSETSRSVFWKSRVRKLTQNNQDHHIPMFFDFYLSRHSELQVTPVALKETGRQHDDRLPAAFKGLDYDRLFEISIMYTEMHAVLVFQALHQIIMYPKTINRFCALPVVQSAPSSKSFVRIVACRE